MSTTYINEDAFEFVAETLSALQDAYTKRAELQKEDAEYFWANQSIQELQADLCSLASFEEEFQGV